MGATFSITATAEISERHKNRIEVHFEWSRAAVSAIKSVHDAKFVSKEKTSDGEPYWHVPLDLFSGRELREAFGDGLTLGRALKDWGNRAVQRENILDSLANADDADLSDIIATWTPDIAELARGYQRAGIKFIAEAKGALIADQPGLGKTLQTIGALSEAGLLDDTEQARAHLIVAPTTTLTPTWLKELTKWQPHPVFVCEGHRKEREAIIEEFMENVDFGGCAFLVVNPAMVRYERVPNPDFDPEAPKHDPRSEKWLEDEYTYAYPVLHDIVWDSIVIDESHDNAIRNPSTMTAKGLNGLNLADDGKKVAMTGTPIENRPLDLWAVLHWLDPENFSSKWRWIDRFCETELTEYKVKGGKGKTRNTRVVTGIRKDMLPELFDSLKPYVLRRTKTEVAPELPEKQYVDWWVPFGSDSHRRQYMAMQEESFVKIADMELSTVGVLDELTRLKQFAISWCHVSHRGEEMPPLVEFTSDSGKVRALEQILTERGILETKGSGYTAGTTPDDKVIVFSQYASVVKMLEEHLTGMGLKVAKVTGAVKGQDRKAEMDRFNESDDVNVILCTTKAAGVSIELDTADTVVFMDETWNASTMEQAEDRADRANKGRTVPVTVYVLRTEGARVEDDIMDKVRAKANLAATLLDERRGVTKKKVAGERKGL